ncbi:hypothetical protein LAZ67_1006135 [Cordylochernes scorpioides]|uniref:Ig-like domain-containing protein n=1 Tax=Cordylochernes scorpioides TaxID=51811 RepID=A0ABY6JZC5_9ARAC|nr:hypothetical protein LAZ67_1006135 [Cordylochernes scorpioides]
MNEELNSLEKNNVWELTPLPKDKKIIGCKWTYKQKLNSKGEIERYKARLVAKGFNQKFGRDYEETFAPIVKHSTIRAFLAASVYKGMQVNHLDVKTAFLHGDLDKELYMELPEALRTKQTNEVCKLKKAIYDIAAPVCILSSRNQNPRNCDWNAAKRIVRYLKTTKELELRISNQKPPTLEAYSDATWASDNTDRKSLSGNLFLLGSNPISWMTGKQGCVSLSSTEAELISAAEASQELLWLLDLLKDLELEQKAPIYFHQDNQSCLKICSSEKVSSRTKHIATKIHHLKDLQKKTVIKMIYCPTGDMKADILTKPLPRATFEKLRYNLVIVSPADTSLGERARLEASASLVPKPTNCVFKKGGLRGDRLECRTPPPARQECRRSLKFALVDVAMVTFLVMVVEGVREEKFSSSGGLWMFAVSTLDLLGSGDVLDGFRELCYDVRGCGWHVVVATMIRVVSGVELRLHKRTRHIRCHHGDGKEGGCVGTDWNVAPHRRRDKNADGRHDNHVAPAINPFSFPSNLREGMRSVVTCSVLEGDPPLTIRWTRENGPLDPDVRVETHAFSSTLFIDAVDARHAGNYTCEVSNHAATARHSASMVVNGVLENKDVGNNIFLGWCVDDLDKSIAANASDEMPFDVNMLSSGMINRIPRQLLSTLVIRLQNSRSIQQFTKSHLIQQRSKVDCLLSCFTKCDVFRLLPPQWRKLPTDRSVIMGDTVVIDCQSTGFPEPRTWWEKSSGSSKVPRDYQTIISNSHIHTLENGSLMIREVDRSDQGLYLCQAANGVGPGLSKVIKLSVHESAYFKLKSSSLTLKRGETALLQCEAFGEKPLTITWNKEGEAFSPSLDSRYTLKKENKDSSLLSVLQIKPIDRRDSALFSCLASNQYGQDDSNIHGFSGHWTCFGSGGCCWVLRYLEYEIRGCQRATLAWDAGNSARSGGWPAGLRAHRGLREHFSNTA